jgi:hypothetical protein
MYNEKCLCELQPRIYIKFKRIKNTIYTVKMSTCNKIKFTIDSSLENFEESKDTPCEFYEETVLSETPKEKLKSNTKLFIDIVKIKNKDKNLTPLIAFFLADNRRDTYNRIIKEIPLKKIETTEQYTERLKTFIK